MALPGDVAPADHGDDDAEDESDEPLRVGRALRAITSSAPSRPKIAPEAPTVDVQVGANHTTITDPATAQMR